LKDGQKKNTTDDNENRSATNRNFRNSAKKIVKIQMQDKEKQRKTEKNKKAHETTKPQCKTRHRRRETHRRRNETTS
jgi:hypothetical protein